MSRVFQNLLNKVAVFAATACFIGAAYAAMDERMAVINSVNIQNSTVALLFNEEPNAESYSLPVAAKIVLLKGREGVLGNLHKGDVVSLLLDDSKSVIYQLEVLGNNSQ